MAQAADSVDGDLEVPRIGRSAEAIRAGRPMPKRADAASIEP
jgi:hypothetical protein